VANVRAKVDRAGDLAERRFATILVLRVLRGNAMLAQQRLFHSRSRLPTHGEKGRFFMGNSGGGRRKGSGNKIGQDFLSALCDDFTVRGFATIAKVREIDPAAYIRICAKLVPKEYGLRDDDRPATQLSDG
jgi:hypothetical protein